MARKTTLRAVFAIEERILADQTCKLLCIARSPRSEKKQQKQREGEESVCHERDLTTVGRARSGARVASDDAMRDARPPDHFLKFNPVPAGPS